MSEERQISFKDYLRQAMRSQKNPVVIDEYDDFILKIWVFFDLRAAAEDHFVTQRHRAKSPRRALPLDWKDIGEILKDSGPPHSVITQIAKKRFFDVEHLLGNLRKILTRVHQKEFLGRVQQIDSRCLRWLTRQPGRSPVEKAGFRQEILAVTRVENFNTLENRVLKDFLVRGCGEADFYLRRYAEKYPAHETIKSVMKFRNLCKAGLSLPMMDSIRGLHELPQPNYVLQQDSRYSKIWTDYCRMIRQEEIAGLLWLHRDECLDGYEKLVNGIGVHCSPWARYHVPIWFNDLDGRRSILDSPWWKNELEEHAIEEPQIPHARVVVVDFTSPWDGRDELVYGCHDNAKPFIQNPHRQNNEPRERTILIREIVRLCREKGETSCLRDYLEQLHGLLGGEEWVVLVPDDWDAQCLERVKRSCPLPRHKVFLLWRSIAAILGTADEWGNMHEGDSYVIADGTLESSFVATKLIFKKDAKSGKVLPQRASFRLHSADRFAAGICGGHQAAVSKLAINAKGVLCLGLLSPLNFPLKENAQYVSADILICGVEKFLADKDRGVISYFDELDAFTLIRTNQREEIEKAELIEHQECWPGGMPKSGEHIYAGTLAAGESEMSLYMFEGIPEPNSKLKLYRQKFDEKITTGQPIYFDAELTPGQGLATITVHAEFLEHTIELELHNKDKMRDSDMTMLRIERELKRHFPPNMPFVEASPEAWALVFRDVRKYLEGDFAFLKNGLFYNPQPYYGEEDGQLEFSEMRNYGVLRRFDPETMSPIDKLKRENVFGNNPSNRYPDNKTDFPKLFRMLVNDYLIGKHTIQLLSWTYQYDNPDYEPIRERLFRQYTETGALNTMEVSFCSNNFQDGDDRICKMLKTAFERLVKGIQKDQEFRLIYNLLQFHPESIQHVSSELCKATMNAILLFYNKYPFYSPSGYWGKNSTKMAGYLIKCLLFILHRRRFDDEFLKYEREWLPQGFFAKSLPQHTPTLRVHEQTRKAFIEYVNGRGTLEGIPND